MEKEEKPKKRSFDVSFRSTDNPLPGMADWRTIGSAWQEADGKIIVKMGGLPFADIWDGSLVLFPRGAKKEEG